MAKQLKNLLVQYQGGGYGGCFWEWNFFVLDARGHFHNILSTGRRGIKTRAEALAILKQDEECSAPPVYTYKLTNAKARKEFATETNNRLVDLVSTAVNKLYGKIILTWGCDECGETCGTKDSDYPCMFRDEQDYKFTTKLCESCYGLHSCGYCGSFNDTDQNNIDEAGHCEYCAPKSALKLVAVQS